MLCATTFGDSGAFPVGPTASPSSSLVLGFESSLTRTASDRLLLLHDKKELLLTLMFLTHAYCRPLLTSTVLRSCGIIILVPPGCSPSSTVSAPPSSVPPHGPSFSWYGEILPLFGEVFNPDKPGELLFNSCESSWTAAPEVALTTWRKLSIETLLVGGPWYSRSFWAKINLLVHSARAPQTQEVLQIKSTKVQILGTNGLV